MIQLKRLNRNEVKWDMDYYILKYENKVEFISIDNKMIDIWNYIKDMEHEFEEDFEYILETELILHKNNKNEIIYDVMDYLDDNEIDLIHTYEKKY